MLASPLMPTALFSTQSTADELVHYRPAKDLETFNRLLPPPIEFVEGSSSGSLAVVGGKYEPINASPKVSKLQLPDGQTHAPISPTSTPSKTPTSPSLLTGAKSAVSLHPDPIDLSWPLTCNSSPGLFNSGNTCFMNSALQCLLHTPPLLRLLFAHKKDNCRVSPSFCMTCNLRMVAVQAYNGRTAFTPSRISNNLQIIAKHMRKGRQEDSHEFLRYAIDALQKSCLAGHPPKLDAKIAETTWVHKLFGGRLRSRVTCRDCGHNSDTFDRILDLSLDIFRCDSLKDALRKFINIDHLKGADKYKCEKCKKHVNAEKQFTIHEAPPVLTVHLKRFSPLGRKISHLLQYDEGLSLRPFMSEGSFGPTYTLYGVICHAGGGPNSGHYYAFVKDREGVWLEMNDDFVTPGNTPVNKKNAYVLFYIQSKGQGLEAAVKAPLLGVNGPVMKNGLAAGMKKKTQKPKETEVEEDTGVKVDAKFVGPLLPSLEITPTIVPPTSPIDPQAISLKAKIDAVAKNQATQALAALGNYGSDGSSDKEDNAIRRTSNVGEQERAMVVGVKEKLMEANGSKLWDKDDLQERSSSPPCSPSLLSSSNPTSGIPAASFYAKTNNQFNKKRRLPDLESHIRYTKGPLQSRTNGFTSSNPFNRPINKKRRIGL